MHTQYKRKMRRGNGLLIKLSEESVEYHWGKKKAEKIKTYNNAIEPTIIIPFNTRTSIDMGFHLDEKIRYEKINSKNVGRTNSPEYETFLNQTNRRLKIFNSFEYVLIITLIGILIKPETCAAIAGICTMVLIMLFLFCRMELIYEIDEHSLKVYNYLREKWASKDTPKLHEYNPKTNNTRNAILQKKTCDVLKKLPIMLRSNIDVFGIKLKESKIYFLPDRLLIISRNKMSVLFYQDVEFSFGKSVAICSCLPKGARQVGSTMEIVNEGRISNRRFTNKKRVPVVAIGYVTAKYKNDRLFLIHTYDTSFIIGMKISAKAFFPKCKYDYPGKRYHPLNAY